MSELELGWLKRQMDAATEDLALLGGSIEPADVIMHCKTQAKRLLKAQGDIAALKQERDKLIDLAAETDALLYLIGQDVAFMGNRWEGKKWVGYCPALLCNDTFGYACAEAEEVPEGRWRELKSIYEQFGEDGLNAWMALQRGCEPIDARRTAKYKEAKEFLDSRELRHHAG